MKLVRSQKGMGATMTFEVDHAVPDHIIQSIKQVEGINRVIVINQAGRDSNENC